jgi:Cu/Zn superoxide dismutase
MKETKIIKKQILESTAASIVKQLENTCGITGYAIHAKGDCQTAPDAGKAILWFWSSITQEKRTWQSPTW